MPQRIQRQRTKGWRMPLGAVNVDRRSKYGNPYPVGCVVEYRKFGVVERFTVESRAQAVALYRRWVTGDPLVPLSGFNAHHVPPTLSEIRDLAGKDLVCWCPLDEPCHSEVLLELANGLTEEARLEIAADVHFERTRDAADREDHQ